MGQYNVIQPCGFTQGGRAVHHTRPTTAPVEVDDAEAAPLVEAGQLEPRQPEPEETLAGGTTDDLVDESDGGSAEQGDSPESAEEPARGRPGRRRAEG